VPRGGILEKYEDGRGISNGKVRNGAYQEAAEYLGHLEGGVLGS
jgi:hypothetical protein